VRYSSQYNALSSGELFVIHADKITKKYRNLLDEVLL
jgi:hypothetical protein